MGRYGSFNPNTRGLAELLAGPEMQAEMKRRVDRGKDFAEATAPVGPEGDPHRGEYKDGFRTEVSVEKPAPAAFGGPRATGRLINDAPHAVDVEYGGGGRAENPTAAAHHTMTRSLDAMRD